MYTRVHSYVPSGMTTCVSDCTELHMHPADTRWCALVSQALIASLSAFAGFRACFRVFLRLSKFFNSSES